jgi:hypothetical protein
MNWLSWRIDCSQLSRAAKRSGTVPARNAGSGRVAREFSARLSRQRSGLKGYRHPAPRSGGAQQTDPPIRARFSTDACICTARAWSIRDMGMGKPVPRPSRTGLSGEPVTIRQSRLPLHPLLHFLPMLSRCPSGMTYPCTG